MAMQQPKPSQVGTLSATNSTIPSCRQEIPLSLGRRVTMELPEDINEEEIAKVIRVLQALSRNTS
jgi:hypothetical protein